MPPPQPAVGAGAHPRPSAAVDSSHIASSNATANAFLGGRQPSWMNSGAPTRNPVSRPVLPRSHVVPPVQQQQQQPVVLPSPAPSDEPSPPVSNVLDSPKTNPASFPDAHNMESVNSSAQPALPVTDARFVHVPSQNSRVHDAPRTGPGGPTPRVENRSPAFGHMFQPPSNGTQGVPDRHSPSISHGGRPSPTMAAEPVPPPKRRRTERTPSNSTPCFSLLPALEQYFYSSGGDPALDGGVEKPRMMLLSEACKTEDGFFIVLHQLFCLWSLRDNRHDVLAYLPLTRSTVDEAFTILETLLKKNQLMSPARQLWFSRFPVPAGQFNRWLSGGTPVVNQIATFLDALVNEYTDLANASMQRKYPFLVDELLGRLGCYSSVLQFILFTACRRRLGVPDDHLGSSMEQAFRKDQRRHHDFVAGRQALVPFTYPGELKQRNRSLIDFYMKTVQAAAFRTSGQPNVRSPPVPSTPTLQQAERTDHSPSAHNAQHHQVVPAPHSVSNPSHPMYPSAALPQSSQAPMAVGNPYTTPQGTTPLNPSVNTQTSYQQGQITPTTVLQYSAGANARNQQSQVLPPLHPSHQQRPLAQVQQAVQGQQPLQMQQPVQGQQLVQGQYLPSQQLNWQQYQRNSQITASIPPQLGLQSTMQPPTATSSLRAKAIHSPQLQQMHYSPWTQPAQPVVPPSGVTANRAHPGAAPAAQFPTPQIQRVTPQRQQAMKANDRPLLPPKKCVIGRSDWAHEPSDRKSLLMSLHQAHVRSPKRVIKDGETERFYQAVKSLPVAPTPVAPKKTMYEFRFEVTDEQLALAATKSKIPGEVLPVVEHFNGALRWRVRCCVIRNPAEALMEDQWVTLDMSWPSFIHMTLNGKVLDVRRQTHNGKDMATEITDFIACGTNILMIAVCDSQTEKTKTRYLAVEMLETLSHSSVVSAVQAQGMTPEAKTLGIIKKRLTSSLDDEVAFEAPHLSIDLADPFSSTIFKTPARGIGCTHMECFDLENWLNTRPAKAPVKCAHRQDECPCKSHVEPSNPDKWRCPICSKDARPCSLRIDEFLLNVRAQLERDGKLHTKCLQVKADGSWSVILEAEDNGDSDGEGLHGPRSVAAMNGKPVQAKAIQARAMQSPMQARREVEVIEID